MSHIVLRIQHAAFVAGYKDRLRNGTLNIPSYSSVIYRKGWLDGWLAADKIMNRLEELKRETSDTDRMLHSLSSLRS